MEIVDRVRRILVENADEKYIDSGRRYFKEEVTMYGMKTSEVTRIAKKYFSEVKDLPKEDIFALCEEFWKSGMLEESLLACHWSYYLRARYGPDDFRVFERWLMEYVTNWASCDTLCNHNIGDLVTDYPQYLDDLKRWAVSPNRWMRRGSAVTLIIPARNGLFRNDIFEIADILHSDSDDLVQKGYGWMLKACSEAYMQEVYDYVISKKATMPRVALRYAIEKMPQEMRKTAMMK